MSMSESVTRKLHEWTQRKMIRRYQRRLFQVLAINCGQSEFYDKSQVETALHHARLGGRHSPYAYAMFCSAETFASWRQENGIELEYEPARMTIVEVLSREKSSAAQSDDLGLLLANIGGGSGGSGGSVGDSGGGCD